MPRIKLSDIDMKVNERRSDKGKPAIHRFVLSGCGGMRLSPCGSILLSEVATAIGKQAIKAICNQLIRAHTKT